MHELRHANDGPCLGAARRLIAGSLCRLLQSLRRLWCPAKQAHIARLAGLQLPIAVAQVKEATNFAELVSGEIRKGAVPLCVSPTSTFHPL